MVSPFTFYRGAALVMAISGPLPSALPGIPSTGVPRDLNPHPGADVSTRRFSAYARQPQILTRKARSYSEDFFGRDA
jgi:hypothetical protein